MLDQTEMLTGQQEIANLAKQAPDMSFTSLNKHLTIEWLKEAYDRTRKDGAPGVDGQTSDEYEKNLQKNLEDLLERMKSGKYFAPPVKRAHIPKGNGETRPLGIATFEDKIAQRAIHMILEPIYEQDFYECSYGFRPKRTAHDCVKAINETAYGWGGGYVIDLDIRKYFDSIDKSILREILQERVRDGVIKRLLNKWLKAGVWEKGEVSFSDKGTPQGAVISPLLANIYLHRVLDQWFHEMVKPVLQSEARLFRFADDAIIVCRNEQDARRIMNTISKRFNKFGLKVHPEKTKLVDYTRPKTARGKGESFDFLGFTFYWGKSRRGKRIPKMKTAKDRFARGIRKVKEQCKGMRHWPIERQQWRLNSMLQGHYNYYGVSHNFRMLKKFFHITKRTWKYWLQRRSQRRDLNWEKLDAILSRCPLKRPRICVPLF